MTSETSGPRTALIGHTGFVGGTLARERAFGATYNSRNIDEIAGRAFDLVVCAGAPAEKWKANAEPERDRANIQRLIDCLATVRAARVALVSTVDVFADPQGVDESTPVATAGLHAYGRHRHMLEEALLARFDTVVLRLPGLYGRGLKKNVIFDFLHDNDVHKVDSRGVFQFYGLDRLGHDLDRALASGLPLVHLATEPVTVAEVARSAFGRNFDNPVVPVPARYDFRTRHAALFGGRGPYIESRHEVLQGIRRFVDAERG